MSSYLTNIAQNTKKYRLKNALTQDGLARRSGVAYNVIIKIESGATSNPTIETVTKIARTLNVTIDELIKPAFSENKFICTKCSRKYSYNKKIWKCECGGILNLIYNSDFPIEKITKRKFTLWRYREAIPIDKDINIVSLDEPITPLTKISIENRNVFIKHDYYFSSGTYKDRGATVLISKLKELGIDRIIEDSLVDDSSGSASNAIASYCAHGNITCNLYSPFEITKEKYLELKLFGTMIHQLSGSKKEITKDINEAVKYEYYANQCWNPFFFHGTKTFAFEIWEQLGWKAPDVLIIPVGNGTLLLGAYIGFRELFNAGMITSIPKIIGVQSTNCAPLYFAYKNNLNNIPKVEKKDTLAEGIAIADPIRGLEIIEAVKDTKGKIISVSEEEIKKSLRKMYKKGFVVEPVSAATIAGVEKYLIEIKRNETIVAALTGNGAKSVLKIYKLLNS